MKFGLRGFSVKKRISSRIKGRGTRNIKRLFIPRVWKKRNRMVKESEKGKL